MKTLLITAFAAVFALQVQGQKILQEYIYPEIEIDPLTLGQSPENAPLESIETNNYIKLFMYNDAGELTGYILTDKPEPEHPTIVQISHSANKKTTKKIDTFRRDTTVTTEYADTQNRIYRTDIEETDGISNTLTIREWVFGADGITTSVTEKISGTTIFGRIWHINTTFSNLFDSGNKLAKVTTNVTRWSNESKDTVTQKDSVLYWYDELDRLSMFAKYTSKSALDEANADSTIYTYSIDESDPNLTVRHISYSMKPVDIANYSTRSISINKKGEVVKGKAISYSGNEINNWEFTYKYDINGNLVEKKTVHRRTNSSTVEISSESNVSPTYNEAGDITEININWVFLNPTEKPQSTSIATFTYLKAPKATSVAIYSNQKIAVTFNYELDPATANVKEMLQLSNNTSGLSISNAYVNAENNSQLIIELNRQVVKDESFDIATTSKLPLKYGRTVALEVKVDGQTPTADGAVRPNQIVVSQTSAGISITAGAEIVSVKVFTASGVLAQSLQPASNEATISTENLPAGVYQVFVTDADGNSASQTVSF